MARRVRWIVSLALVAAVATALSPPVSGEELVVALVDASDKVEAGKIPTVGDPCGPALKDLRRAGLDISQVHGIGRGLLYTLRDEGKKGKSGGVVVVGCVQESSVRPLPDR